ncbi:hypothetical protein Isop_0622 [Isosphaera pallida ATCC 43644]|uniref:Cytochrome c-552/4 domain-containing protein n=1 Tax=Isosphaera pallida (strain ATCC 43644 / DSM 9630 / IS1B) TaxID=575540 RepID=E8R0M9_ISOPI|nr:multiheme c-type cytochrome [Isosphaera pallida]ADV61214.1 hypothetical protein Isop_0622 [Isosphaera pallida ATCC 43644]
MSRLPNSKRVASRPLAPATLGLGLSLLAAFGALIPFVEGQPPARRTHPTNLPATSAVQADDLQHTDGSLDAVDTVFFGKGFAYNNCFNCHHSDTKSNDPRLTGQTLVSRQDDGILGNGQYEIWFELDKHEIAHASVMKPAGQAIIETLGYDETQVRARCLVCHAPPGALPEPKVLAKAEKRQDLIGQGVGCESCHGPAEKWHLSHAAAEEFNGKTASERARAGFLDTRNPLAASERCANCHVGKGIESSEDTPSWLVTHDMYAAGHPPLPGFEVVSFAHNEPKHWRWLAEKKFNDKYAEDYRKELGFTDRSVFDAYAKREQSHWSLLGGLVSFREAMRLLAAELDRTVPRSSRIKEWAFLDCTTCHHELKRDAWRQDLADRRRAPGRIPFAAWQSTFVDLAIDILDEPQRAQRRAEWTQRRADLAAAFVVRPFGDARAVRDQARELARFARDLADELWYGIRSGKLTLDDADLKRLLARIADHAQPSADRPPLDFDSARQLAFASLVLLDEIAPDQRGPDHARAVEAIHGLRDQLHLVIENKRQAAQRPASPDSLYVPAVKERLSRQAEYDPRAVAPAFGTLAGAL